MEEGGVRMPADKNPIAKVGRYKERTPEIRFLTLKQIDERPFVLQHCPQLQTIVAVLIYAGLRREELLWLTHDDVDLKTGHFGMLRIRAKTIDGRSWQPKTAHNRVVPISPTLRRDLDTYTRRIVLWGWLFPSPAGTWWDPGQLFPRPGRREQRRRPAMVLPRLSPHVRLAVGDEGRVALQDQYLDGELARDRALLTLATGTGKTSIAFQIAWKLFAARWNLIDWKKTGEPARRPRILFLADRNTLANQAFSDFTSFAAFNEDDLVRIKPDAIKKKGKVPKNGQIFFTIFQTFMSGPPKTGADGKMHPSPYFGEYEPDFFDLVIIDECHRGGANDESTWRDILEYFAPAVQLGLTATPKRRDNVDTYKYFGEPLYTYSLKDGINDGFLTPFRVKQYATTIDEYVYTSDDHVVEGEIEVGDSFDESDFNRTITIEERERKRVKLFLEQISPMEKTIVFCANQEHALLVRDLINQNKSVADANYCHRVTANDGELGEQWLRAFQDNEKTIPTILTTSQKLSTGVDARNVRNIVLMRPINSMIEFKQIIGRGTRLFEGKDYFTIHDFVKAHEHFADPEWDGEPVDPEVCEECGQFPCECPDPEPEPCPKCGQDPSRSSSNAHRDCSMSWTIGRRSCPFLERKSESSRVSSRVTV